MHFLPVLCSLVPELTEIKLFRWSVPVFARLFCDHYQIICQHCQIIMLNFMKEKRRMEVKFSFWGLIFSHSSMSRCFLSPNPSSTFANFATFAPPPDPAPCPFHLRPSFSWNAAAEVKTKVTASPWDCAHACTHTHNICSRTLNQGDTSTCFCTYCINALSCTSSSTAFVFVLLLHHPDCTWTQHSAFLPCVGVLIQPKPLLMSHIKSWRFSTRT